MIGKLISILAEGSEGRMATQNNSSKNERIAGDVGIFNKFTLMMALNGLAASFVNNGLTRKPILSGGHRHIASTLVGAVLGYFFGRAVSLKQAEKEFYIQDYINRHPEDFKAEQPKKMSEVLHRWAPVR